MGTRSKINVIIPTRERHDTLKYCLKTVVAQNHDDISIIVSDNHSTDATREIVMSFNDPRIRYINTGERVSMSKNFEFALSHVDDGWIAVLGDDDGLLPGRLVPAVERLEESGLEAMSSETCHFNWPSIDAAGHSILSVPLGRGTQVVDSVEAIRVALGWHWRRYTMPQTYTGGIVSAALYRRIRAIRGTFFQSQIPDVYSGYAITGSTDRFLFDNQPFAIAGRSGHSIGEAVFNLKKTSFHDEGLIPFHSDFPLPDHGTLTFSMPAIVCESYKQAEFIHGNVAGVTPADMLRLILAHTHSGRELLPAWGRQFARHHELDYDTIAARARPDWSSRARHEWRRATNFVGRYRIDASYDLLMDNVYDAAITADTVLSTRPGRLDNWLHTARRSRGRPGWH